MIKLTQDFLRNELDYTPTEENSEALFKDYYIKLCTYIFHNSAFGFTLDEVEQIIEKGYTDRAPYCVSPIKTKEQREYCF
jgi:hypothetical protein